MTTLNFPPPASFKLGGPELTPRFKFSATIADIRLDEKYRPTTLSEVIGQGAAVFQLETFLDAPHSTAFLFEGESGVGKSSMARALANDLGVDRDWGFDWIESAKGDMEAVERSLKMLRHVAPGSGWKLILVDEADLMTPKASHLWLSALENLPPKSIVVFTTNRPSHFPDRFLDRCERLRFESNGANLKQDAQTIVDGIWRKETGSDDAPSVDDLPNTINANGVISFRRAVLALGPMLRAKQMMAPKPPKAVVPPVADPLPIPWTIPPVIPAAVPLSLPERIKQPRGPNPLALKPIKRPAPPSIPFSSGREAIEQELRDLDREEAKIGSRLLKIEERRKTLVDARKKLGK
jgi:hypothetical protein